MRRAFAWGKGHGVLQCGCRNLRLHITAPCPMPHAIKFYTVLSMSESKDIKPKGFGIGF